MSAPELEPGYYWVCLRGVREGAELTPAHYEPIDPDGVRNVRPWRIMASESRLDGADLDVVAVCEPPGEYFGSGHVLLEPGAFISPPDARQVAAVERTRPPELVGGAELSGLPALLRMQEEHGLASSTPRGAVLASLARQVRESLTDDDWKVIDAARMPHGSESEPKGKISAPLRDLLDAVGKGSTLEVYPVQGGAGGGGERFDPAQGFLATLDTKEHYLEGKGATPLLACVDLFEAWSDVGDADDAGEAGAS